MYDGKQWTYIYTSIKSKNPYRNILRRIYGHIIIVSDCDFNRLEYHVPSSFEEMAIICDLNGN